MILVACNTVEEQCSNFSLADGNISNQEEYLIIEAVINEYEESDVIRIVQETHYFTDTAQFSWHFRSIELNFEPEKIEEYKTLNSTPSIWGELFEDPNDIISEEELECLIESNNWSGYYDKYDNSSGYLKIGRPIQIGNDEALVTYEFRCGGLCSSGYTVTLKKENDKWEVDKHLLVWIS